MFRFIQCEFSFHLPFVAGFSTPPLKTSPVRWRRWRRALRTKARGTWNDSDVWVQIRCLYWEFQQTDRQTNKQTNKRVMKEMTVHPIQAKSEGSFNFRKTPQVMRFLEDLFGLILKMKKRPGNINFNHFCWFPKKRLQFGSCLFSEPSGVPHHQHQHQRICLSTHRHFLNC